MNSKKHNICYSVICKGFVIWYPCSYHLVLYLCCLGMNFIDERTAKVGPKNLHNYLIFKTSKYEKCLKTVLQCQILFIFFANERRVLDTYLYWQQQCTAISHYYCLRTNIREHRDEILPFQQLATPSWSSYLRLQILKNIELKQFAILAVSVFSAPKIQRRNDKLYQEVECLANKFSSDHLCDEP